MTLDKKILSVITFVFVWVIVHVGYTIVDGTTDSSKTTDVAVILGNTVNPDGTLSERLRQRLLCGLNAYNNERIGFIIVSGGLGKEGYYEAEKMKDFLVGEGVSERDIIVDNKGDNTIATVDNVIALKDSLKFNSVLVVSQYFHLTRTKMLFRQRGLKQVTGISPTYFELRDIYSIVREFLAFYFQYQYF